MKFVAQIKKHGSYSNVANAKESHVTSALQGFSFSF